jgi:hypothetical protein
MCRMQYAKNPYCREGSEQLTSLAELVFVINVFIFTIDHINIILFVVKFYVISFYLSSSDQILIQYNAVSMQCLNLGLPHM